jgi:hypothetical protein
MPRERLLVEIVRNLRQHRLSNEIFTLALAELGRKNSSGWSRSSVTTAPSVRWPTPLMCVPRMAAKLSE